MFTMTLYSTHIWYRNKVPIANPLKETIQNVYTYHSVIFYIPY